LAASLLRLPEAIRRSWPNAEVPRRPLSRRCQEHGGHRRGLIRGTPINEYLPRADVGSWGRSGNVLLGRRTTGFDPYRTLDHQQRCDEIVVVDVLTLVFLPPSGKRFRERNR